MDKKLISIFTLILIVAAFSGCGDKDDAKKTSITIKTTDANTGLAISSTLTYRCRGGGEDSGKKEENISTSGFTYSFGKKGGRGEGKDITCIGTIYKTGYYKKYLTGIDFEVGDTDTYTYKLTPIPTIPTEYEDYIESDTEEVLYSYIEMTRTQLNEYLQIEIDKIDKGTTTTNINTIIKVISGGTNCYPELSPVNGVITNGAGNNYFPRIDNTYMVAIPKAPDEITSDYTAYFEKIDGTGTTTGPEACPTRFESITTYDAKDIKSATCENVESISGATQYKSKNTCAGPLCGYTTTSLPETGGTYNTYNYCDVNYVCLNPGTSAGSGRCCPKGYVFDAGDGKCCPPGTLFDSKEGECLSGY